MSVDFTPPFILKEGDKPATVSCCLNCGALVLAFRDDSGKDGRDVHSAWHRRLTLATFGV